MFFNTSTRKRVVRHFFSPCNTVLFNLCISGDGKTQLVEFDDDESYEESDLNESANDDVEEFQVNAIESNYPVLDLVSDSDLDEEGEMNSKKHSWIDISLFSLTTQQRNKYRHMVNRIFIEKSKKNIIPFIWKIDGLLKTIEDLRGQVYSRYYNAKFPKPRKYADFEYTQPEYFVKIATPDAGATFANKNEEMKISSEGVAFRKSLRKKFV